MTPDERRAQWRAWWAKHKDGWNKKRRARDQLYRAKIARYAPSQADARFPDVASGETQLREKACPLQSLWR